MVLHPDNDNDNDVHGNGITSDDETDVTMDDGSIFTTAAITTSNVVPDAANQNIQMLLEHFNREDIRQANFTLFTALNNLGVAYLRERRYVEAIQSFSDALRFVVGYDESLTIRRTPTYKAFYLLLDDGRRRVDEHWYTINNGNGGGSSSHNDDDDDDNHPHHHNNNSNKQVQQNASTSCPRCPPGTQCSCAASSTSSSQASSSSCYDNIDENHHQRNQHPQQCEHCCVDSTYVFQYPIVLSDDSTSNGTEPISRVQDGQGAGEATIKLSLVVLYNLSLAYHRAALDLDSMEVLQQALVHYEIAYRILISESRVLVSQAMVILNNIGHIHRLMHNEDRARACFQYLLTTMIYVQQSGESQHIHHWESFFSNVVDLIAPCPRPAAAA